jgi:hypothetical protein
VYKRQRFFLYLAHSMPHVPLGVSDKYKGKSEQGIFGDVIMEIDWSVGEIIKTLKKNNIDDNTLVIFTSDNGPWLNYGKHAGSAKPLREGKGTMWEGGVRVPCIMRWPGNIKEKSVTGKLTTTMDLLPTIVEISGADLPEKKIDGVNILPVMLGDKDYTPREELWYYYDYDLIAVRKNDWKLFFPSVQRSYEGMEPGENGFPGPTWQREIDYELYNLSEDIGETNNVIDEYPDIVETLKSIGDRARYELGDRLTNIHGKENREPGRIGSKRVQFNEHLAVNKNIELSEAPSSRYGFGNEKLMIDGWDGSLDYNDGKWLGFEGKDLLAVVDLGEKKNLQRITVSFLQSQGSWIFYPQSIVFAVSLDGHQFEELMKFDEKLVPFLGSVIKDYKVDLNGRNCRYVRIYADNIDQCPDWHSGKGGKAWIFIDEIKIE